MEQATALFGKATFAMDRGYDDNKIFLKLDALKQDYVIRIKSNRKLFYHNKWTPATELRNRRKGKVKTSVFYRGKDHEAYLSHVNVQITASRKKGLSGVGLRHYRTSHDAGNQQRHPIKERGHPSGKNLFFPLEDRGIFPL